MIRVIIRINLRNKIKESTLKIEEQIWWTNYILIIEQISLMKSRMSPTVDNEESEFCLESSIKKKRTAEQNKNYRYSVINYQKRVQLINLASSKGYSISRAARELGIKPSTGKFIVKCFRDYGKIMKKATSQTPKLPVPVLEQPNIEPHPIKKEKEEKDYIVYAKQQNNSSDNEPKTGSLNSVPDELDAPMYYFTYPYEQPHVRPILFYPGYENFNGMAVPYFFPQTLQY